MASGERLTHQPHYEEQQSHVRHHRVPKHLEDYVLAYNPQRPALSSHTTEEQRGAAAAADGSRADAASFSDRRTVSQNTNSDDILNTTSLKRLVESISRNEKEEDAEVVKLTHKLQQYELRRRQELLEHIASFMREEEKRETEKSASPPSMPSSPVPQPHRFLISPATWFHRQKSVPGTLNLRLVAL